MNWGKSIVLVFVLFAGFIGTMVVRMSRQQIDLVRDDYYQDEIAYQKQINRVANARRFEAAVVIQYRADAQQIQVTLPDSLRRGILTLYCPADRRQDVQLALTAATPAIQTVSMQNRPGGVWRAQLSWSDDRQDYYLERELRLP